jgi:uncharacterized protein (DUF488 family)
VLRTLYSVGHSNHSAEVFLNLVQRHGIQAVADVRSQPYSRYATHFSKDALGVILERAGIRYVFLGTELGGRPDGEEFYDDEGHVLYGIRAESDEFLTGIERLEAGASRLRIAIMCSEEDPLHCHRRLLVARVLEARGAETRHIRRDGRIELEGDLLSRENGGEATHLSLFEDEGADHSWRSTRSVSRARPQPSSSAR